MKRTILSGFIVIAVITLSTSLVPPSLAYEDSLVGYWRFDETSGPTAYDATGGYNGTIYGTTINQTGVFGGAYSFDGSDDKVITTLTKDSLPITMSAWIYSTSSPGTQRNIISNDNGSYDFGIVESLGWNTTYTLFTGSTFQNTAETLIKNEWVHLTATIDGSASKLYVNGVLEYTGAAGTAAGGGFYLIGAASGVSYFQGLIDDVAVWNRAFDSNEIEAIYLVGIYKFEAIKHALDGLSLTYTTAELLDMAELEAGLTESATLGGAITFVRSTLDDSVWTGQGWTVGSYKYDSEDGLWFIYDEGMVGGSGMVPSDADPGAPDGDGLSDADKDDGVPEPSAMAVGGIAIALLSLLKRMRKNTES